MDSISASSTIAFAIDLYQKGILTRENTGGIDLKWGDRDALITLMDKIAHREGLGDLLAEGVMRAAAKIGKGAEYYAHHAKGLELALEDPRVLPGVALGFAVGPRMDTTRGMVPTEKVDIDPSLNERAKKEVLTALKEQYGTERVGYHTEYEGKEKVLIRYENDIAMRDILGMCKFLGLFNSGYVTPAFIGETECATLYSCLTGQDTTAEQLLRAAEALITLERALNARFGISRASDKIPERFFKEPVVDGRYKGALLDFNRFEKLKEEYYKARRWDVSTGVPSRQRLEELGLQGEALLYSPRINKQPAGQG
jgi:aldehyde:ferredoxin oxidoreductase